MRWRPGHLLLLIFQIFWLNIVIPGHTRGAIALPGAQCESCAPERRPSTPGVRACCLLGHPVGDREGRPGPRKIANCAICAFAARVTPPLAVDVAPVHLGLLAVLPLPPPQVAVSLAFVPTYYANGPPGSLA